MAKATGSKAFRDHKGRKALIRQAKAEHRENVKNLKDLHKSGGLTKTSLNRSLANARRQHRALVKNINNQAKADIQHNKAVENNFNGKTPAERRKITRAGNQAKAFFGRA